MRIQGISMKKHTERGDELPGEVTAEWRGKQYPAVLNEYGVAIITGPAIEEAAPMILLDEVTQ